MASTIKLKNGSGAPLASDLVQGEPALDLTNKRLYTEDSGGTVIEIGTKPSTIDINAGTIDGTVIGGSSPAEGAFTNATVTTAFKVGLWEIKLDTNDLRFVYNGTDVVRITTAGEIIALDDVSAFGAP